MAVSRKDALTSLEQDHRRVSALFRRLERARGRARLAIARELSGELSLHAAIEEQVLYPFARALLPRLRDRVLESFEEHHLVKRTLGELQGISADDDRLAPKLSVLRANVEHHVEEEERELFPALRAALGPVERAQVSDQLERARAAYSTKRRAATTRRRRAA